MIITVWKVFSPNTRNYGPEITPYLLDTFHAVSVKDLVHDKRKSLRGKPVQGSWTHKPGKYLHVQSQQKKQ